MFFQDIIQNLNNFWSEEGCLIMQPYDTEKGAGTMNPHTFLRAIGPEPWSVAYAEPCRDLLMDVLAIIQIGRNITFNIK